MAINEKIIRHQKLWLLAIVLVIIILSVISTLWFRGFFPSAGNAQGYRNITLTDAVITCENEIRETHKQRLRHLTLDNLSSRFDEKTNFFRVFFVADLQVAKEAGAPSTPFLVSCFVGATRGDIKGIELFEKKESTTEPIQKRDGGIFGWPL